VDNILKVIDDYNKKNPNSTPISLIHFLLKIMGDINGRDSKKIKNPLVKISAGVHIVPETIKICLVTNFSKDKLEYVVLDHLEKLTVP